MKLRKCGLPSYCIYILYLKNPFRFLKHIFAMKKIFPISIILSSILLAGCPRANINTFQIINTLKSGASIQEISAPATTLPLPPDIDQDQIEKYFKLGDILFALALRPSMNAPMMTLPKGFIPSFSGVLIAGKNYKQWTKLLEIKDKTPGDSSKNNPYFLWESGDQLFLSVVDQNGAGSGEGAMKIFTINETGAWELADCYYFGGSYSDPALDGDYFAFSSKLSKQEKLPIANCEDDVELLPNTLDS